MPIANHHEQKNKNIQPAPNNCQQLMRHRNFFVAFVENASNQYTATYEKEKDDGTVYL